MRRVDAQFTAANSMTLDNCRTLFYIYENAIKAPIIENSATIPQKFWSHDLLTLGQAYGVWNMIPASLQTAIQEMNPFYPVRYTTELAFMTLVNSSSVQEWSDRIRAAQELLDFMEQQVIANSATFSHLTF